MRQINKEIAKEMFNGMSDHKAQVLEAARRRNGILTSTFDLENVTLTIYKEGFYLEMTGCRSRFALWCFDRDGELVEGRKPAEKSLHKIYSEWGKTWDVLYEAC